MQERAGENTTFGAGLCFAAMLAFSLGGLCVRRAGGLSPFALHGARCAVAALLTLGFCLRTGHRLRGGFPVAAGALCLCLTGVFYIFAAKLTTAACAISLQYTSPAFAALLLWVFGRRPPGRRQLFCVGLVLLGTALCWRSGSAGGGLAPAGVAAGLCSGLTFAGVFLAGSLPGSDMLSACFWGEAVSAVCGLPFLLAESPGAGPLFWAGVMGLVQTGGAYLLLSLALARCGALTANLICAQEPVYNALWVALFCGELPPAATVWGGVLIVAGGVLSYLHPPKAEPFTKPPQAGIIKR